MSDPKAKSPPTPPRQLLIAFDAVRLRGMSAAERQSVVATLAIFLMAAARAGSGGRGR